MAFPPGDVDVIRDLARRVAEIAAEPIHAERAGMWRRLNRLEPDRPMVLIFPEGSWRELLPEDTLACADGTCRGWEMDLRRRIYYWEELQDDNVVAAAIPSPIVVRSTGWGVQAQRRRPSEALGAAHFDPVIETEEDIEKVKCPEVSVDWEATDRRFQETCEVFDDILPVERQNRGPGKFAATDMLSQWRGLEQLLWDMADRPEWVHRALQFMTEAHLSVLDTLESEGALTLNNGAHYCGSGGVGFSDELPQEDFDGERVRAVDSWGFATTQIFSEVSPAMHDDFALRYEMQWLSRFGLNAYGCCEPLHKKLDSVKQIPRVRRISMSPWVDVEDGAAQLEDKYIFSYKPNPAVMAEVTWDADAVRRDVRKLLEKTRGCVVEMVMKDTHTCAHQPDRMTDWTRIARDEAERFAA
jgi:hypothetical protein